MSKVIKVLLYKVFNAFKSDPIVVKHFSKIELNLILKELNESIDEIIGLETKYIANVKESISRLKKLDIDKDIRDVTYELAKLKDAYKKGNFNIADMALTQEHMKTLQRLKGNEKETKALIENSAKDVALNRSTAALNKAILVQEIVSVNASLMADSGFSLDQSAIKEKMESVKRGMTIRARASEIKREATDPGSSATDTDTLRIAKNFLES